MKKGKKCKCRISGVRKKKWKLKEKFREKKSQSVLGWILELKLWFLRKFKIRDFYLLVSYPLVGRHVDWKVQSYGQIEKLKWKLLLETKMIAGVGFEPNHVWAPCCETWLKREIWVAGKREWFKEKKCLGRGLPR